MGFASLYPSYELRLANARPHQLRDIIIRPATEEDAALIAAIHAASWRDANAHILAPEFLNGPIEADRSPSGRSGSATLLQRSLSTLPSTTPGSCRRSSAAIVMSIPSGEACSIIFTSV